MEKSLRHTPFVLAALWMAVAWYHWRTSVLLPPECVFQFPEDRRFRGFAPNGDAMLLRQVTPGSRPDGHEQFGPIEFWRLPERTKVREVFTGADAIPDSRPDALGRMIVIRDEIAWLADFDSGRLLEELPGVETKSCQPNLCNDRLIWVRDQTAFVYDLTSKRVLASYPGQRWAEQISGSLWSLPAAVPNGSGGFISGDATVLDLATGELDHRFDALAPIKSVMGSPDGKFAVIKTATTVVVCELASGKQLWSMPLPKAGYLRFEMESAVVLAHVLDEKNQIRTARWRAKDGTVIDTLPDHGSRWAERSADAKGRYSLDHRSFQKGPVLHAFSRGMYEVKRWMRLKTPHWPLDRNWIWEVRDLKADKVLGVYSYEQSIDLIAPDGSGFVVVSEDDYEAHRVRYYELPPGRDWWWLLQWGVLPPALFVMLRWGLGTRRRARDAARVAQ